MSLASCLFAVLCITMASAKEIHVPTKTLNDGNKIPTIALGTSGTEADIAKMRDAINWAIEAGYRHIDTAAIYENEAQIGQGLADVFGKGIVKREDVFITTKLWNDRHARDQVVPALRESLSRLGLDYVDLYLIHFPIAEKADGTPDDIDYLETWKGMEEAKKLGLAKSIGVSNFNSEQLDRLMANSEIKPAVNQVEVNPTLTQERLVSHSQKLGITVMAYSPFGFLVNRRSSNLGPAVDYTALTTIAEKYNKSINQIVVRYLLERGMIPIPKSTNKHRIGENLDVFDFQLTENEIVTINKYNTNVRVINGKGWENHPYFPFNKD